MTPTFNYTENFESDNQNWLKFYEDHESNNLFLGNETFGEISLGSQSSKDEEESPFLLKFGKNINSKGGLITFDSYKTLNSDGLRSSDQTEDINFDEKNVNGQNRNTIKFMMRLFLKYHSLFSIKGKEKKRTREISETYGKLYNRVQGKINLTIYKHLFNESKFSKRNAEIFREILGNKEIIDNELMNNKNIKRKMEYYITLKIMRIRCRSGQLCERTECR